MGPLRFKCGHALGKSCRKIDVDGRRRLATPRQSVECVDAGRADAVFVYGRLELRVARLVGARSVRRCRVVYMAQPAHFSGAQEHEQLGQQGRDG